MTAYCDRQGHPENSVIFLYDGETLMWSLCPFHQHLACLLRFS